MRILIADDEPLALLKLQSDLACIPQATLVGAARNGDEAAALIRELKPDVAILDIEMPGRDGFGVVESLKASDEIPEIIFVTAFSHYAVKAFQIHAVDYLTKPVTFDRLKAAISQAEARLAARSASRRFDELQALIASLQSESGQRQTRYERELWVRRKDGLSRLPVETIDLIEAQGDYVNLVVGEDSHMIRDTVSSLEHRLDPAEFARCHRSFIVNLKRVRGVRRRGPGQMTLTLETGRSVSVGPSFTDAILKAVNAKRWR